MRKTAYRFLCMVLTICMLCTMTVITALAEDTVTSSVTVGYGTPYTLPNTVDSVTGITWEKEADTSVLGTQIITGVGSDGTEVTMTANVGVPKLLRTNRGDSITTNKGDGVYKDGSAGLAVKNVDGNSVIEQDFTVGTTYFETGDWYKRSSYGIQGKSSFSARFKFSQLRETPDVENDYTIYKIAFFGTTADNIAVNFVNEINLIYYDDTNTIYARPSDASHVPVWNEGGLIANVEALPTGTDWIAIKGYFDAETNTLAAYVNDMSEPIFVTQNIGNATGLCLAALVCRDSGTNSKVLVDDLRWFDENPNSITVPTESTTALTQKVAVGDTYSLPAKVGGVDVDWDVTSVDVSSVGRQIIKGTNFLNQRVTLTVNVGEAISPYNMGFDKYGEGSVGDFESTSLGDGLIIRAEDKGTDKISIISDDVQGKVLKIGPGKTSYDSGLNLSQSPVVDSNPTLSFKIKPVSTGNSTYTYPGLIDVYSSLSDNNRICRLHLYWGSNGGTSLNTQVQFRNETASGYENAYYIALNFSNGTPGWLDIKLVFDHTNQTYDVYVGGKQKATGQKYYDTKADTQVGTILFRSNDSQGYFMMDDVKITKSLRTVSDNLPIEPVSVALGLGANSNGTFTLPLEMSDGQNRNFTGSYTVDTSKPGYKSAVGTVEGFNAETVLINAKVLSYEPVDFVFEKDGSTSAQPENGGKLKSINVKRYTASSSDALLMVAIYDNNTLKTVKSAPISGVALGESKMITLDAELPADVTNLDIRTFIWDGKDTLKPIDIDSYWESAKKKPVIYLAGDSTTEDVYAQSGGDYYYPRTGWGEKLSNYIDTDKYVIDNRGKSGRSTKSYIDEGRLDDILEDISVGDYLFINFGHNDQATNDPSRGTTVDEYKENLRTYIDSVRSKGANPVLVTSVPRLVYKVNGTEVWGHQYTGTTPAVDYYGYENLKDRTDAMKAVAAEKSVPYLDLNILMADHIRDLSIEDAKDIYMILSHDDSRFIGDSRFAVSKFNKNGINYDATYASNNDHDTTHLNYYGADLCASFVAQEIEAKIPSLAAALTNYTVTKPAGW